MDNQQTNESNDTTNQVQPTVDNAASSTPIATATVTNDELRENNAAKAASKTSKKPSASKKPKPRKKVISQKLAKISGSF